MKDFKEIFDWERTVVLELNREHEFVCRERKVRLRPVAITLFDSETLWGQFDGVTRTISISRKLIHEFAWHQVLGIFRHEMAHQLVAEMNPEPFMVQRPHDEVFQEACKRLGVPPQFTKAGINLQSCDLDWRNEKRDEATEKTLDKVRKLLALATSANEHEALLAMERVRELYAKYNLEQIGTQSKEGFVHLVLTNGKKRMESWEQRTISILTEHFFVKVLTFKQFDAKSGERHQALEIIGTRENVSMAEYVYHFLLQQVEFLISVAVKQTSSAGSSEAKRFARAERASFRLGILDGFSKKLKSAEKRTTNQTMTESSSALSVVGQALAKFHEDDHLEDYLHEIYPRLGRRRGSSFYIDDNAFAAGHKAGSTITLNKPIVDPMGNQGRILTGGKS